MYAPPSKFRCLAAIFIYRPQYASSAAAATLPFFSTLTASSGPAYGARFEIKEMGVPFRFSIKRGNSEFFIVHLPVTIPSDCRLVKRPNAGTPRSAFGCPVGVPFHPCLVVRWVSRFARVWLSGGCPVLPVFGCPVGVPFHPSGIPQPAFGSSVGVPFCPAGNLAVTAQKLNNVSTTLSRAVSAHGRCLEFSNHNSTKGVGDNCELLSRHRPLLVILVLTHY